MTDINTVTLCGRLASPPEIRTFESGTTLVRLLVTVRQDEPRSRVDVLPVSKWLDTDTDEELDRLDVLRDLDSGTRVHILGSMHRRFWESEHDGSRRNRLEIIARSITINDTERIT